jgi:hypothetical protein
MLKSNKNFALIFILLNTIALFSCTNRDSKNRNTNDTTAKTKRQTSNTPPDSLEAPTPYS